MTWYGAVRCNILEKVRVRCMTCLPQNKPSKWRHSKLLQVLQIDLVQFVRLDIIHKMYYQAGNAYVVIVWQLSLIIKFNVSHIKLIY